MPPFQTLTKAEVMSKLLAQKRPLDTTLPRGGFVITPHFFCIDISRCSLSCLCTLCRLCHWISYLIICVRICTCLHEHKCLWRGVCRESSRCAHPCGRLLHPFASQAEWSFPGSFGASRSVISVSDSTLDRLQGMHHCLFGWFLQPATPCSVFDTVSASTTSS